MTAPLDSLRALVAVDDGLRAALAAQAEANGFIEAAAAFFTDIEARRETVHARQSLL